MEGAKNINGGKSGNEVFLECGNGMLSDICLMVVRGDELDVDCFGPDVLLNRGRTFIVHYIQCCMVAAGFQYGDDFGDHLYHGSIGVRWHGLDNDCIKVIDVGNKHVLHTFEGADWEGAGDVGIHGAHYGIGERGKAEHILHSTDFLGGNMQSTSACAAIMSDCTLHMEDELAWCCCMCPLLLAVERGR